MRWMTTVCMLNDLVDAVPDSAIGVDIFSWWNYYPVQLFRKFDNNKVVFTCSDALLIFVILRYSGAACGIIRCFSTSERQFL